MGIFGLTLHNIFIMTEIRRLVCCCSVLYLTISLTLLTQGSSAASIPTANEADFLNWLVTNYKSENGIVDKRGYSPWAQFNKGKGNRGCNPLYDWNCNNPNGRTGRR